MFCKNCGNHIEDGATVCSKCNQSVIEQVQSESSQYYGQPMGMQTHTVPKCTCCGHVGEMKPGPILTKSDWLWFFMLLFLAGAGFIFLGFRLLTRADPKKREKICPNCGSKNMFTYVY